MGLWCAVCDGACECPGLYAPAWNSCQFPGTSPEASSDEGYSRTAVRRSRAHLKTLMRQKARGAALRALRDMRGMYPHEQNPCLSRQLQLAATYEEELEDTVSPYDPLLPIASSAEDLEDEVPYYDSE